MEFYRFEASSECMAYSAVDKSGSALDGVGGPRVEDVDNAVVKLFRPPADRKAALPDRICVGTEAHLVVSRRAREAIARLELPSALHFIPATVVVARKKPPLSQDYYLGWCRQEFDVLNTEQSELITADGTDGAPVIVSVREWVLDARKLPDLDLFFASPNDWMCTERLASLFRDEKLTGAEFHPCKVS